MAELKEKLFSEFAPVSTEEWMAKITADLKGVPFEKKLVWKTGEGFNVNPFYRAEDIEGLKTTESLPGEFPMFAEQRRTTIGRCARTSKSPVSKVLMKKPLTS